MMKKVFATILALAMSISLVACGSTSGSSAPAASSGGGAAASAPTASTEKITLKLTHPNPESHVFHKASVMFKEEVETLTNGNVTVEIYPNGQLGDSKEIIQSVSMGAVELNISSSAQFSVFNDELNVLDLPFLFPTREDAYARLDGDAGARLAEGLVDNNVKVLGYLDGGYRNMFNSKRALETPADFQGLAVRVQDSEVYFGMMNALGAIPSFLPWGDLYVSIQQGVVDAGESGLAQIAGQRFYEVAPYISLTNHTFTTNMFVINQAKWDSLPADYQAAIQSAAEKMVAFEREQVLVDEENAITTLKDNGATISEVNAADFQAAVAPVWDDFAAKFGQELVDLFTK